MIEAGKPLDGEWLWTTRPGSEQDVVDEITLALGADRARVLGPAVVRSRGAPTVKDGGIDLTFARQGFRIAGEARGDREALVRGCADAIERVAAGEHEWALAAWVPDTDALNPLAPQAQAIEEAVADALEPKLPNRVAITALPSAGAIYAQIALVARDHAIAGTVKTELALGLAHGGRARMRVGGERPSRAARKVEEALAWLGVAPGAGEVCVDLGAAPGGWSWVLLDRRAKVIAIDPAELRPDIARNRNLVHHKESAFQYAPEEPADWLFCDMAWKPLEVAQLLAKWGRRRWARILVANLKLPMKKKAATVADLKQVIAGGGWQRIRARQLYHDRDEITLTAHL
ncbi:MAG: 23S rRNA (cytidine(2498)-2'-O)-methyltransferase RlmM [Myxococcota bacterium]|nr:23S rRNA (cytidine(2498)-2'-O)-methyltransferase RlmM [Myxococcota bacterium]